jgi:hypothetical protein
MAKWVTDIIWTELEQHISAGMSVIQMPPNIKSKSQCHEEFLKVLFNSAKQTYPGTTFEAEERVWSWLKDSAGCSFVSEGSGNVDERVKAVIAYAKSMLTPDSAQAFLRRAQTAGLIGRLRTKQANEFTIGVVGPQRLGKSTLLSRIFCQVKTNHGANPDVN